MKKRALVVGINYEGTSSELRGCINDANTMQALLLKQGFTVEMVLEKQATTQGILSALGRLTAGAEPGDVLVFHYSGHGSQVFSTIEPDKMDEIICPIDLDWIKNVIRDDDLKRIFNAVPVGVNTTVILDCCHSGDGMDQVESAEFLLSTTGTKAIASEPITNRYLPMPADMAELVARKGIEVRTFDTTRDVNRSALLIAGCDYNQTSADAYIAGKYQGAATYALSQAIAKNPSVSYYDLVWSMNKFMVDNGFTQRPQLDGAKSLYSRGFLSSWVDEAAPAPIVDPTPVPTTPAHSDTDSSTSRNFIIVAVIFIALFAFFSQ